MRAYFTPQTSHGDGLVRARRAALGHDAGDLVVGFISLDAALLALLQGSQGRGSPGTVVRVARLAQTVLLAGFELDLAAQAMTAYMAKRRDDDEAVLAARAVLRPHPTQQALDELVSFAAVLVALRQAERGGSATEALDYVEGCVELVDTLIDKPFLGVRGPRSLARLVVGAREAGRRGDRPH